MTYEEIKRRLTSCESKLKELQVPNNPAQKSKNYNVAVQKLEILKESLQKQLKEAEKTAFINGKPSEYKDEKELQKFKDNVDVKSIETAAGKKIKEQEGIEFSIDETKAIAKQVGKAVGMALNQVGDEIAHMKAKKVEPNSFEIYVEYKNESDDQFSFYVSGDTLHLVDFSFDKELVDVGVKPSGEAIVHVEHLANELVKHFKSLGEDASPEQEEKFHKKLDTLVHKTFGKRDDEMNEAPEGMYYIEVSVRDARKALAIIDDQPALRKAVEMNGSTVYYLTDEELAYDLMMDFGAQGIEVVDTNIDEDNLEEYRSDYSKRRAAERDYQPAKKDKPAKTYKEPRNDYFARRRSELDHKYGSAGQEMYEEAPEGGIEQGGDLDVGHQDDEPNMLLKDVYDIAQYAAKLHKALVKYDQFDGEVDFPQWWQKKVILARDYISAAQHYLEAEEKQPALDQLALEENRVKVLKEDWGSSDHAHMMQQIHKAIGEPKTMPSPFDGNLEAAVQDNVDFYWDDWEEYQQDPQELYTKAKRDYLRYFFKDTFNKMVQMFEPVSESVNEEKGDGTYDEKMSMLQKAADVMNSYVKEFGGPEERKKWRPIYFALEDFDEYMAYGKEDGSLEEGIAKTQKAHGLVVAKMKELAKQYKAGDTSVVAQLKDLTAKKKQLEKQLEKDVAGKNRNQQLDTNIDEGAEEYDDVLGDWIMDMSKMGKSKDEIVQILKQKLASNESTSGDEMNEDSGGQSISDLKPGDKFEYNGKTFTLVKHKEGNIATVILPSGDTSTVSFGGKVNTGKKAGIGPHSFGQGKGHHIDENEEKVYIDFLNKDKGFQQDRIYFDSYEDAVKWGRKNFERFDSDMIRYQSVNEEKDEEKDYFEHWDEIPPKILKLINFYHDNLDKLQSAKGLEKLLAKFEEKGWTFDYGLDFAPYGLKPLKKGLNKEQGLNEGESTCCGRCGRKHVKGTKCKTPYLKGKDHCRTK